MQSDGVVFRVLAHLPIGSARLAQRLATGDARYSHAIDFVQPKKKKRPRRSRMSTRIRVGPEAVS